MAEHSGTLNKAADNTALRWWQHRPLAVYAAGAWSLLYALLAIYWAFGGGCAERLVNCLVQALRPG